MIRIGKTMQTCATMAMLSILMAVAAWGAADVITIQGKLTGSAGRPLTGSRVWRVQFYNASSGGSALGAALTGSATVAASGRFSIELTPPAQALAAADLYYQLAVDSASAPDGVIHSADIFPGRVRVVSVMRAQRARDAEAIGGLRPASLVTTTTLAGSLATKSGLTHSHTLQSLGGAVTDAQVPDSITINYAQAAGGADLLDGYHASAFAQQSAVTTALLGKSDTSHLHDFSALAGAVSDAQVPDSISIDFAKTAGLATSATLAAQALNADNATTAAIALEALHAQQADNATTASVALLALQADNATTAAVALQSLSAQLATNATTAVYATNAGSADLLDGFHASAFAQQSAVSTALLGKSDTSHLHNLSALTGAVTDAQVPDTITINNAKAAGTATTATVALTALAVVEKDTLANVTGRGASTATALTLTNATDSTSGAANGALAISGGVGVGKRLNVTGDVTIAGNLYVRGAKTLVWQTATVATQARPNSGIIANGSPDPIVITLPTTAESQVGDIVRVAGLGQGGWKIAQNGGQKIMLGGLDIRTYKNFTTRALANNAQGFAMSPDGGKMFAGIVSGALYSSSDYGTTWTSRVAGPKNWRQIAATPDGIKLITCAEGGNLYTSVDGGVTWTSRESVRDWFSVAISDDGTKMAACVGGFTSTGLIYTSTDSGQTWTARDSARAWSSIAMSADGATMLASAYNGFLYVSTDGGANWTAKTSQARQWTSVLMTPDGAKMVAFDYSTTPFVSYDKGATWLARNGMSRGYLGAMTPDGSTLCVAHALDGGLYVSTDGGICWERRASSGNWRFSAITPNKDWIVGATQFSQIQGSRATMMTETSLAGYLSGGPDSAVELQYIGGGVFTPLSHNGPLGAK